MILIKAVWYLLVAICLALEMYGIIKKHSGLMIFSCVFRIFYVIGNVVVCIVMIVFFSQIDTLFNCEQSEMDSNSDAINSEQNDMDSTYCDMINR